MAHNMQANPQPERSSRKSVASYPFFIVHQPVILFIAFYAVQWDAGIPLKLLVVVLGSLLVSLGLYEVLVRRINPVHALFGMKPKRS